MSVRAPFLLGVLLLGALAACEETPPPPEEEQTISRETFVSAYVDLRLAELADDSVSLTPEERTEILSRHDVTGEDLLRFVEVHGDRPEYIRDVWAEVEERILQVEEPEASET